MRFFAECVALVVINILALVVARRVRWDLFGGIFAAGMCAVLVAAPVAFVGWLVSRSEWFGQSRSVLWIGGALFVGGFLVVQLAFLFYVPRAAKESMETPKRPTSRFR